MAEPSSALASLVTQAEDPEEQPQPQKHVQNDGQEQQRQPQQDEGVRKNAFCRCAIRRSRDREQTKLSSVVPIAEDTQPAETSVTQFSQQATVEAPAPDTTDTAASVEVPALPTDGAAKDRQLAEGPATPTSTAASELARKMACTDAERIMAIHGVPPDLPPQSGHNIGRKTLVLDLDETLIHSSFRVVPTADLIITVELEGENHMVYVRKRPGVDMFLARVAEIYEVVIYTASMAKYANPLMDQLDTNNVCAYRLFREACTRTPQGYMKDLSKLGRDLKHTLIIDNSPICYALQPSNAIPIKTWKHDESDIELIDLLPILCSLAFVDDIPAVLRQIVWVEEEEPVGGRGRK